MDQDHGVNCMKTEYKIITLLLCSLFAMPFSGCKAANESDVSEIQTSTASLTSEDTVPESFPSYGTVEETETDADKSYVRMLNDVVPDMMRPDYWIANGTAGGFDMNQVLMTPDEIAGFNRENHTPFKKADGTVMFYWNEIGNTFSGEDLIYLLEANRSQIPVNPSEYYLNGKPTTSSYWQQLASLDNIDEVSDSVQVRYGFTVKRSTLRLFPTEDKVYKGKTDKYFDYNLFSECMPYTPCLILHESSDGNFYYVVFDSYAAWVSKEVVALCSGRDDWQARQNPPQFLTVTAREIRLGNDPHSSALSNLVLPMGTQMELVQASDAPSSIHQRTTYGNYVVKVPTRDSSGNIADEYVLIPFSDDVTVGVLEYTSGNLLRQTFKLLGDRYGWGGDLQANDCTGIIREVYKCFGILMPRTGQTAVTGVYKYDLSGKTDSEKIEVLKQMYPGSILSLPGHMMIYIGTVNNRPYVISAVGTFVEPKPGPDTVLHPESVVLSSLYVRSRRLNTWLSSLKTALTVDNV